MADQDKYGTGRCRPHPPPSRSKHRFGCIGADPARLLWGEPATIPKNPPLQDPFFVVGAAKELFGKFAARPEAILVSREAVADFQLKPGDRVTLRLRAARRPAIATRRDL